MRRVENMRIDMTFERWMKEVNEDMLRFDNKGAESISQKNWHIWYVEGYTPMQAVETALMNRGFSFDDHYYLG